MAQRVSGRFLQAEPKAPSINSENSIHENSFSPTPGGKEKTNKQTNKQKPNLQNQFKTNQQNIACPDLNRKQPQQSTPVTMFKVLTAISYAYAYAS